MLKKCNFSVIFTAFINTKLRAHSQSNVTLIELVRMRLIVKMREYRFIQVFVRVHIATTVTHAHTQTDRNTHTH